MKRLITITAAVAALSACTASSDDVGAVGVNDAPGVAEGVAVCPDNLILDLVDYPEQALPSTTDAAKWLEVNGGRDGVVVNPSGLQYTVVSAPMENGLSPKPRDEIFAHYHGFKPDGSVFDSSYSRGAPLSGGAQDWIKGWNEALADMKVCEARTLYIPANLAYGDNGRVSGTLLFHMQLLRVNSADRSDSVGINND